MTLKQQYNKARKNALSRIRYYNKKGYDTSKISVPKKPKRITQASINRLNKISAKTIKQKAGKPKPIKIVVPPIKLPGNVTETPKTDTQQVDLFSNIIISNFRSNLSYFNEHFRDVMTRWLDEIISKNGYTDTAIMLQRGAERGLIVEPKLAYDDTASYEFVSEMMDYLPDQDNLYKDELLDAMMEDEDFNPLI